MRITVPANYIKALNLFVPKTEIREYLLGIYFDVDGDTASLVAIDGCRMGVLKCKDVYNPDGLKAGFIVPSKLINMVTKAGYVAFSINDCSIGKEGADITLEVDGLRIIYPEMIARYPDWRKLFPKETSGKPAIYNPNFIGDFGKASKFLTKSKGEPKVIIEYNGDSAAIVKLGNDDFIGIIMPLKADVESPA